MQEAEPTVVVMNATWPPSRTADELKAIALGLREGQIFTDRHIREGEDRMIEYIFTPLALGALVGKPR